MSASHVSFPAITMMSNTSSWTLNDKELPYAPTPYSVPSRRQYLIRYSFSSNATVILKRESSRAIALPTTPPPMIKTLNRYFKFNKLHYENHHNDATDSEHSIYQMKNNLRGYFRLISGKHSRCWC